VHAPTRRLDAVRAEVRPAGSLRKQSSRCIATRPSRCLTLESVRGHQAGLQSFRSMRRIEAGHRKASAVRLRFSESLTSILQRLVRERRVAAKPRKPSSDRVLLRMR
jgi:hypothetical protein